MFKNLRELIASMPDEKTCREYLAAQRWPDGKVICPYCGCDKVYRIQERHRYKCAGKECGKKFSVLVGTVFQDSKIALIKWLTAVYFASANKKGISSYQLGKHIGVSQKTAWFMLMRIREALKEKSATIVDGIVESDETYVGGKVSNMHKSKRDNIKNKMSPLIKTPVLTIMQRQGHTSAHVLKNVTSLDVIPILNERLHPDAIVITDASKIYKPLTKQYNHQIIDHNIGEYKRDDVYTNSVECYFSHFKRMIIGTYHFASPKHLQRYVDEHTYRFNLRKMKDADRFALTLQGLEGRLSYNKLVYGKEDKVKGNPKKEK